MNGRKERGGMEDILKGAAAIFELESMAGAGFVPKPEKGASAASPRRDLLKGTTDIKPQRPIKISITDVECGKGKKLKALYDEIGGCARCALCRTRANFVFGAGSPESELVFVGEAPGRDEDIQGIPFVGRAGQLLTKIIEAMGLSRSKVFICNVLKCRPPDNRNPLPSEILECEEHLLRQLDIIKPKVICALGKFAAQTLLKSETPITALRGKFHDYHGIRLMATYHPAYLLRNPGEKKVVWGDMKKIMAELKNYRLPREVKPD